MFQHVGGHIHSNRSEWLLIQHDRRRKALEITGCLYAGLGHDSADPVGDENALDIGLPGYIASQDFQIPVVIACHKGGSARGGGIGNALSCPVDQSGQESTLSLDAHHANYSGRQQDASRHVSDQLGTQTPAQDHPFRYSLYLRDTA